MNQSTSGMIPQVALAAHHHLDRVDSLSFSEREADATFLLHFLVNEKWLLT